jgi:hypothetical protein
LNSAGVVTVAFLLAMCAIKLDGGQSTRWRVPYSVLMAAHATGRPVSSLVHAAASENIAAAAHTGLSTWTPTHFAIPWHALSCAS